MIIDKNWPLLYLYICTSWNFDNEKWFVMKYVIRNHSKWIIKFWDNPPHSNTCFFFLQPLPSLSLSATSDVRMEGASQLIGVWCKTVNTCYREISGDTRGLQSPSKAPCYNWLLTSSAVWLTVIWWFMDRGLLRVFC